MHIALINNMNNSFFVIARILRDHGHKVDLYIMPAGDWSPAEDSVSDNDLIGINFKVFPFYPLPNVEWMTFKEKLEIFKIYDLVMATGHVISYLKKIGIRVDLYVPYGGDVDEAYGNPKYLSHLFSRDTVTSFMVEHYSAVYSARMVWSNWSRSLYPLGIPHFKAGFPNLYLPSLAELPPEQRIDDFVVCNPSRQMWATQADLNDDDFERYGGYKRNDIFVSGYLKFREKFPNISSKYILFNYGQDVSATLKLFEQTQYIRDVVVYKKTSRINLFRLMKSCDVIGDTFYEGIKNVGFQEISMLATAGGVPLITHTRNSMVASCSHFNVSDTESIAIILGHLYQNRDAIPALGKLNQLWYSSFYKQAERNLVDVVSFLSKLKAKDRLAVEDWREIPGAFSFCPIDYASAEKVTQKYLESLG